IDTAGRLAIAADAAPSLALYDLDRGSVAQTLTLANPASAVYASPGRRYALAFQRPQDVVQVADGGIWQEDHGDHLHDYKRDPKLLASTIEGPQPTHYDDRGGRASIFMDGRSTVTPAQAASAVLFTDANLAAGTIAASVNFAVPMHGFAEPNGDYLVATYRAPEDTGATQAEIYRRDGAGFTFVQRLAPQCPGMHGSYTRGEFTVAGCSDGLLVVRRQGTTFTADRITTPSAVGTIAGHPGSARLVGIGNAGTPATTRFYDIDPAAGTAAPIEIAGWADGRLRRAHGFDRSGRQLFVLDDAGTLFVLERTATGWETRKSIRGAVPVMPLVAPFPAFAANQARDAVYLTDPTARQVVVVDTAKLAIDRRLELDFRPASIAWVGIAR
ncbi:MAG TPA: hypothetical protein VIL30_19950, partial [Ramlibacter sp.]